jgi:Flp pilus assembly protein TadG
MSERAERHTETDIRERQRRGERGQGLLEFALMLPVVLVLLMVIIDFGFAMQQRSTLQHAVREGARYAALSIDNGFVCDRTVEQAQDIVEEDDVDITYSDIDGNDVGTDAGDAVNVKANYTWTFPFADEMLGAFGVSVPAIDMSPTGSSRLERQHTVPFVDCGAL